MNIWHDILNFLLPPRCLKCGKQLKENAGLCQNCMDEITFINGAYCHKCGHPLIGEDNLGNQMLCGNCLRKKKTPFRLSRSACLYDDGSKALILNFKFNDKTENAKFLAQMMYVAGTDIFKSGVDIILPVPLHYTRLIKRRYNQSALMAQELSKLTGLPAQNRVLIKHKRTRPQVELSGLARVKNVKDAFSVRHQECLRGKRVLLIDDVLTTGSTLKECALALKKSGVKSVDSLTVARVV